MIRNMHSTNINLKKLISVLVIIVEIMIIPIMSYDDNWIKRLAIIAIFQLLSSIIIYLINGDSIYSLVVLFTLLYYLFYFGQLIINGLFTSYSFSRYIRNFFMFSNEIQYRATVFALVIIQIITIVSILTNNNSVRLKAHNNNCLNIQRTRVAAFFFIIICLPVNLYLSLRAIVASRLSYLAALRSITSTGGYMLQFSIFLVIGFCLLLYCYPKRINAIYWVEIVYYLFTMLSGNRIYSMISICLVTINYIYITDIKKKDIVLFGVVGVIILKIVVAVSRLRLVGTISITSIFNMVFSLNNSLILQMMEEFGGTIQSVIVPMRGIPLESTYGYGITYISGLVSMLINIHGIFDEVLVNTVYLNAFSGVQSLGGSFVGELYYNFGYFSYVFAVVIGFLLRFVSNRIDIYAKERDTYRLAKMLMPAYSLIIWIRGYFMFMTRSVLWGAILVFCVFRFSDVVLSRLLKNI